MQPVFGKCCSHHLTTCRCLIDLSEGHAFVSSVLYIFTVLQRFNAVWAGPSAVRPSHWYHTASPYYPDLSAAPPSTAQWSVTIHLSPRHMQSVAKVPFFLYELLTSCVSLLLDTKSVFSWFGIRMLWTWLRLRMHVRVSVHCRKLTRIRAGHSLWSLCGLLMCACNDQTDLGLKQLLSDKHSVVLWKVLLLVDVAVCFMSQSRQS